MNAHILAANAKLIAGCERAEGLRAIYEYMKLSSPGALDCSDILRSSLVLAVSSFDLYIHELYRLEIIDRMASGKSIPMLKIPFDALIVGESERIEMVDLCIRRDNSHKSFVAPDKVAECLRILVESPWNKISASLGGDADDLKGKLKRVVDLRNRIAHEADVNPAYGGIELWPIYSEDVGQSISFIRCLGNGISATVHEASC